MSDDTIDSKAFEILVMDYHRRLLGYAFALVSQREVAEDLVQEAFITACQRLDSFDASRSFGAWVRGILRMKYLEWCRAKREYLIPPDELDQLESLHCEWDELTNEPEDTFDALEGCIKALPDEMGEAVNLFYMKEMSGAETAVAMDVHETTVRKRLQRAREKLGDCIKLTLETQGGYGHVGR